MLCRLFTLGQLPLVPRASLHQLEEQLSRSSDSADDDRPAPPGPSDAPIRCKREKADSVDHELAVLAFARHLVDWHESLGLKFHLDDGEDDDEEQAAQPVATASSKLPMATADLLKPAPLEQPLASPLVAPQLRHSASSSSSVPDLPLPLLCATSSYSASRFGEDESSDDSDEEEVASYDSPHTCTPSLEAYLSRTDSSRTLHSLAQHDDGDSHIEPADAEDEEVDALAQAEQAWSSECMAQQQHAADEFLQPAPPPLFIDSDSLSMPLEASSAMSFSPTCLSPLPSAKCSPMFGVASPLPGLCHAPFLSLGDAASLHWPPALPAHMPLHHSPQSSRLAPPAASPVLAATTTSTGAHIALIQL